jgi:hypothetical protein
LTQARLQDVFCEEAFEITRIKPEEYQLIFPMIEIEDPHEQIRKLISLFRFVFE